MLQSIPNASLTLKNPQTLKGCRMIAKPFTWTLILLYILLLYPWTSLKAQDSEVISLNNAVAFHASFDGSADAQVKQGDGKVYTTESLARKQWTPGIDRTDVSIVHGAGVFGDCIRFADKSPKVICYKGEVLPKYQKTIDGTVCFWMRLDPDNDLKPGYCDPIQITDKAWNDAAFFVDFDKDLPRDFRLGVFSDLKYWNPENTPWEKWPVDKRPMVTVKKPGFTREAWKHVAFTFEGINAEGNQPARTALYLDGKLQGALEGPMKFTWDPSKTAVMIGIEYIGDMDELIILDRPITAQQLKAVMEGKIKR
jgi:hypothetical protein